ncbi:hypothetical protein [Nocardia heshunensis]
MHRPLAKALATAALTVGLTSLALAPAHADTGTQTGSASGSGKILALPLAFLAMPLCYNDSVNPNYQPTPLCSFLMSLYAGSAGLLP